MINNKKIFAFDLDGTLAESKQSVDLEMVNLLGLLAEKGLVVVISGGSFDQFKKQFLPFLENDNCKINIFKNLILLPTSGSQCYRYDEIKDDWFLVYKEKMSEDLRKKIIMTVNKLISSKIINLIPFIPGDNIIEDRITQISISALGQSAPLEIKRDWDTNQEKRKILKEIIEKELPDVSVNIGGNTTLDILPKGFNKAVGLNRVLDFYGLKKEELVFAGDAIFPGGNDYSVLEAGFESIKVSGVGETKKIIKEWLQK